MGKLNNSLRCLQMSSLCMNITIYCHSPGNPGHNCLRRPSPVVKKGTGITSEHNSRLEDQGRAETAQKLENDSTNSDDGAFQSTK